MNEDHKTSDYQLFTPVMAASNRPSIRLDFSAPERPNARGEAPSNGSDSPPVRGLPSPSTAAAPVHSKTTKLDRHQLERIEQQLTARDHAVLQAIRKYRFLTTDQIGRLYITDCSTKASHTRHQNLLTKRLANHGLIRSLARRVGGVGGGSSMQIWHLTEAGHRLLTLNDPGDHPRKRFVEPSSTFLAHTLAIAECAVQLTCLCRESEDLSLEQVDTEPPCWRAYKTGDKVSYLKPDLFAITNYDSYEDRWFIEMDLDTESPMQVVEKCNIYLHYYYTGVEQKETGMFPLIVWIVPSTARKERLKEYIRERLKGHPKMFLVITPDELEKMLRQFIGPEELC